MSEKSDYYDILGVSKNATDEELKKAYRKQAIEWHPDKHQSDKEAAEKRFKEINEAYQILSDKEKRAAYDRFGHSAFSPGGAASGAGGFPGGNPFGGGGSWKVYTSGTGGQNTAGFDFGDPFDIFEQFFGGGNPFRRAQSVPRYGVTIGFMEAIKGVEKRVSIDGKERKIKIPAGVDEGSRIRFDDFMLSINIEPHGLFERDGMDIYVKVEIPYSLAVMGGKIEVPTVEEKVKLKIRPGTKSGTMIRLRGKGVTRLHGRGRGDEYVRLQIVVPDKLSRSQKNLIKELEKEGL
ncbi:DnaJ domain-containing protein [Candidatus Woesebacteria bacterium]|nr:MAG: DnaJ domain-containing protein [Candidatus Woesebacteria bacterium]